VAYLNERRAESPRRDYVEISDGIATTGHQHNSSEHASQSAASYTCLIALRQGDPTNSRSSWAEGQSFSDGRTSPTIPPTAAPTWDMFHSRLCRQSENLFSPTNGKRAFLGSLELAVAIRYGRLGKVATDLDLGPLEERLSASFSQSAIFSSSRCPCHIGAASMKRLAVPRRTGGLDLDRRGTAHDDFPGRAGGWFWAVSLNAWCAAEACAQGAKRRTCALSDHGVPESGRGGRRKSESLKAPASPVMRPVI